MATTDRGTDSSIGNSNKVRHSKDDALTELEFERLYNASYELDQFHDVEARFILLVCGRLGLRRGELAHMTENWVDFRKRRLDIPRYVDCSSGRDQEACASCRQHAQQKADRDEDLTFGEALAAQWEPKTDRAVRSVPYGHSPRAELVLNEFFEEFDEWMYSAQAVNRRVEWLAEIADFEGNVYPHALRATAATALAGQGISWISLQSFMGWSQASTAQAYIAQSADNTERELHQITG